jgi:hypothetical protein
MEWAGIVRVDGTGNDEMGSGIIIIWDRVWVVKRRRCQGEEGEMLILGAVDMTHNERGWNDVRGGGGKRTERMG